MRARVLVFLGYLLALTGLFSAVLLTPADFTDSYAELAQALQGSLKGYDIQTVAFGRPLYALLMNVTMPHVATIEDLRWLRFVGLVGLAALALMLYLMLRRVGVGEIPALLIPLVLCSLPPYEVWISWAICAFFPWAAALSGAAFLVAEEALRRRTTWHGRMLAPVAFLLLLLSALIYQPALLVFLVFVAISLLCHKDSLLTTSVHLGISVAMLLLVIGLDALAAKLLPRLLYGQAFGGARTELTGTPLDKIIWFIHEPLLDSFNLWNLLPSPALAGLIALGAGVGLWLFIGGTWRLRTFKMVAAALLLPLSYVPNLVVAESWASYRTQAALMSLVALFLCLAVIGYGHHFQHVLARRAPSTGALPKIALTAALLTLVLVVGETAAAVNVDRDFVTPQAQELAFLTNQLNQPSLATAQSIYVIPCTWSDTISPVARYDEFGLPSCSQSWVPRPMVWLVLRERHPAQAHLPIIVADPAAIEPPPGSLVIDCRLLEQLRQVQPLYH